MINQFNYLDKMNIKTNTLQVKWILFFWFYQAIDNILHKCLAIQPQYNLLDLAQN